MLPAKLVQQLGAAALPEQLLATAASFCVWIVVERVLTERLMSWAFGVDCWLARSNEEKRKCSISVTCFFFAATVVSLGARVLLFPSAALQADPLYGMSATAQIACAIAVGFFLWNILAENKHEWSGWPNFVHHGLCVLCFVFGQYPFSSRICCGLLIFEASTLALASFTVLRQFGLEHTKLYSQARVAFAVLFFVFRILLGLPLTVYWYMSMYELCTSRHHEVHSYPVVYVALCLPLPFMGINLYWFALILKQAIKMRSTSGKGEKAER